MKEDLSQLLVAPDDPEDVGAQLDRLDSQNKSEIRVVENGNQGVNNAKQEGVTEEQPRADSDNDENGDEVDSFKSFSSDEPDNETQQRILLD